MRIAKVAKKLADLGKTRKTSSLDLAVNKISLVLATINGINAVDRTATTLERAELVKEAEKNDKGEVTSEAVYSTVYSRLDDYKIAPAFKVFVEPRVVYATTFQFGLKNMKKEVKFSSADRAKMLDPVEFMQLQEEIYAAFRKAQVNFEPVEPLTAVASLASVMPAMRDGMNVHVDNPDAVAMYPIDLMSGLAETGYLTYSLDEIEDVICHDVITAIAKA